jgi:hypothetical protein
MRLVDQRRASSSRCRAPVRCFLTLLNCCVSEDGTVAGDDTDLVGSPRAHDRLESMIWTRHLEDQGISRTQTAAASCALLSRPRAGRRLTLAQGP